MNVIVLAVDSLRRDYCYGDETDTPTFDGFKDEGVSFDQAISGASMTPASFGSIFSGIYPHKLDMYNWSQPYPDDVRPLFKEFEDAGYEVGSFVFDENYLFSEVTSANVLGNFRDYEQTHRWIEDNADEDFFLFVHHYWVHGPYEPQDSSEAWSEANEELRYDLRENHEEAVKRCRKKYSEAVERMSEEWLKGILDKVDEEGLKEDTLIVFTADHGESWGERFEDKSKIQSNYHMHGKLLYDELIRVPLVLRYPGDLPEGETVEEQVRHVDIFPTLMEIAGLESGDSWGRRGLNLLEAESDETRPAFSSAPNEGMNKLEKISIRYPDEKLIWSIEDDELEYYDLEQDPDEIENLVDENQEKVEELKDVLESELEESPSEIKGMSEIEDHLEDLGYL